MADVDTPLKPKLSAVNTPANTENTATIPQDLATTASFVYEANAEMLYAILRHFLPEPSAMAALENIARQLYLLVPKLGYQRYASLLCLKLAFEELRQNPRAKVSRELTHGESLEESEHHASPPLDLPEAFCLLLRDRFEVSCADLATLASTSEGAIRTRVQRARTRLFEQPQSNHRGTSSHVCIRTREQVEDWNPTGTSLRLGQFTVPSQLARSVGDCGRCGAMLQERMASIAHFHELRDYALPEKFKTFPVSPLLIKEGKKVLLNWAAAPWYVKAIFEGLLTTTLVLGIVLSIPRIKNMYEFWLERRFDLYSIAELAAGLGGGRSSTSTDSVDAANAASPPQKNNASPATTGATVPNPNAATTGARGNATPTDKLTIQPETEFVGRDSEVATSDKVYRVLIKTDSPEAIKDQVAHALTTTTFLAADEETGVGAELPGGVMFNVFVPIKSYKALVNELARMGETKVIITHAKEKGMSGKAHLKIWLQRI